MKGRALAKRVKPFLRVAADGRYSHLCAVFGGWIERRCAVARLGGS